MYGNEIDYEAYIGVVAPTPYQKNEDIAVSYLMQYCLNFPNETTFLTLPIETQTMLVNAIYLQMEYMQDNIEIFRNGTGGSFSIGKYSETKATGKSAYYNQSSLKLLDRSGYCNNWVHDGVCCGC